jgi:S-adenosylmethionine uptake transporter
MPFVYLPMPGPDLAIMVAIAVMAFAAMQLVILAYRRAEAVVVAPMQYSQIIWAVVYGMLFFDETPDLLDVGGGRHRDRERHLYRLARSAARTGGARMICNYPLANPRRRV